MLDMDMICLPKSKQWSKLINMMTVRLQTKVNTISFILVLDMICLPKSKQGRTNVMRNTQTNLRLVSTMLDMDMIWI